MGERGTAVDGGPQTANELTRPLSLYRNLSRDVAADDWGRESDGINTEQPGAPDKSKEDGAAEEEAEEEEGCRSGAPGMEKSAECGGEGGGGERLAAAAGEGGRVDALSPASSLVAKWKKRRQTLGGDPAS